MNIILMLNNRSIILKYGKRFSGRNYFKSNVSIHKMTFHCLQVMKICLLATCFILLIES